MGEKQGEFVGEDREVMDAYYDLCERYEGGNTGPVKIQLKGLIEEGSDFLDSYLMLYRVLKDEGNLQEGWRVLNDAYGRAVDLITDEGGRWPDTLEWGGWKTGTS